MAQARRAVSLSPRGPQARNRWHSPHGAAFWAELTGQASCRMSSDPADALSEIEVADERQDIEQYVSHDQRQDAAGALEPPGEDQAHHKIPGEPTESLVKVVAPPQHRARPQRLPSGPTQLTQQSEQVADHDDLLEHAVLGSLQQEEGHAVPGVRDVHYGQVGTDPELVGGPDQDQAG